MSRPWDGYVSPADLEVMSAAGYGLDLGVGERPAVLTVDVCYDFVGHQPEPVLDSVRLWRDSCGERGWEAIAVMVEMLEFARSAGIPVIHAAPIPSRSDGVGAGKWRTSRAGEQTDHFGLVGTDIVADVAPVGDEIVVRKPHSSAFFQTALPTYLDDLGVDTLLVCGTTTSGCVRATVVDAFSYGFKTVVVEDATFDRVETSHAVSLFDMHAKYADVTSWAELRPLLAA